MKLDFFARTLLAFIAGAILAALVHWPAGAAEGDLREIKLGTGATQYQILVPFPAMGTQCIRFMDGADGTTLGKTLGCWKLGASLTVSGGDTLNAAAAWADITGKPTFATVATSGAYADLAGIPSTFAPSAHTHPVAQISDSTATGRALVTATDAAAARAQIGAGTVTSVTAGTGLSGGTITSSGTISLPNVGTASTYSGVTTDSQGRVSSGTVRSFAYQTRALNTCFQLSASRDAYVVYPVEISASLSLSGGTVGTVYLRTYTNSGCSTGTQEVMRAANSNTGALTIGLNTTQVGTGTLTGIIPAGLWVQLVTENTTGTPAFTARPGQEVLL